METSHGRSTSVELTDVLVIIGSILFLRMGKTFGTKFYLYGLTPLFWVFCITSCSTDINTSRLRWITLSTLLFSIGLLEKADWLHRSVVIHRILPIVGIILSQALASIATINSENTKKYTIVAALMMPICAGCVILLFWVLCCIWYNDVKEKYVNWLTSPRKNYHTEEEIAEAVERISKKRLHRTRDWWYSGKYDTLWELHRMLLILGIPMRGSGEEMCRLIEQTGIKRGDYVPEKSLSDYIVQQKIDKAPIFLLKAFLMVRKLPTDGTYEEVLACVMEAKPEYVPLADSRSLIRAALLASVEGRFPTDAQRFVMMDHGYQYVEMFGGFVSCYTYERAIGLTDRNLYGFDELFLNSVVGTKLRDMAGYELAGCGILPEQNVS